jgi:GNAT superfamily N-acetyltransferase
MIIRDALEADLPAIVEIYNEAIRGRISTAQLEEVSVEQRRPWFRQHSATSHPLWVAEIEGEVAGWFSFHPFIKRAAYRGTAEISVYVSEKFRRRGVAKASSFGLLVPIVAGLLSAIFFGEPFGPLKLLGAGLVSVPVLRGDRGFFERRRGEQLREPRRALSSPWPASLPPSL